LWFVTNQETQGYCPTCQRNVLARHQGVNHILHFLVSFFTCGLWLIVWLVLAQRAHNAPWFCPTCASRVTFA
jgi:competence CoiA-like predicted nuclease